MTDPAPNPFKKWPRNLPCFCGSGQKFKKCCDDKIGSVVALKDWPTLRREFKSAVDNIQAMHDQGKTFRLKKPVM